jgi:hypothetical protein
VTRWSIFTRLFCATQNTERVIHLPFGKGEFSTFSTKFNIHHRIHHHTTPNRKHRDNLQSFDYLKRKKEKI